MRRAYRRRNRGSVMVVALSLLVVFSMMASALGFRSGMEVKLVKRHLDLFREKYLALGVVAAVQYLIEKDEDRDIDGPFDSWYNEPVWPEKIDFGEYVSVRVTDEESKVNINYASEQLLTSLLEQIDEESELETEVEELVSSILYWRGGSSIHGGSALGFEHKGAPFESLDELLLIKEVTAEDVQKIRPYLTVFGLGTVNRVQINPNTAPPIVLKALIRSLVGDERAKEDIILNLLTLRAQLDGAENQEGTKENEEETSEAASELTYFRTEDLMPQNLLLKLGLSSEVTTVTLINQLSLYLTVDSKYFNVEVDVKGDETSWGTRAQVVIGMPLIPITGRGTPFPARQRFLQPGVLTGGGESTVLSWREF